VPDAILKAAADDTVHVVILTGEGWAFCASVNLKSLLEIIELKEAK
jgi:enoyl-CoA hydratase/carnithine racemase